MILVALVLVVVLVVAVVGPFLFLGRTVVLNSPGRGEIVFDVLTRVDTGRRTGVVGLPGEFPIDVHIWYEVFMTNPFEVLCLLRLRPSGLGTVAVRVHVVRSVATGFEVEDRICDRDM